MTTDQAQFAALQQSLEADDYHLSLEVTGDDAVATITAGPDACAECLVPKDLMKRMLSPMIGVDAERIEMNYPVDVHAG
ncbi:hypothetical protein [Microbacterium marinilacus]|uniref:NifU family protein n=1 Tax=Microbacterium marinilacus TaxID=415209 RepID=A0ABP7BL58_9MICO|nr:hypothetical protein [Microbacterium marinilacus]MBY0688390.1 hypothetical protein [Microbacterium marinilacus]